MKDRKIILRARSNIRIPFGYIDDRISWALCTKPNAKGVSYVSTDPAYCRENLVYHMFNLISNEVSPFFKYYDRSRMRLMARILLTDHYPIRMRQKRNFKTGVTKAVKLLNTLEQNHGWLPTKIQPVKNEIHKNFISEMLIASRKWMRSPAMVSLFCLIVRSVVTRRSIFPEDKITNMASVDSLMKEFSKRRYQDAQYIKNVWPYIHNLMGNYDEIFRNLPFKRNWNKKSYKTNSGRQALYRHQLEGINKLMTQETNDQKLKVRIKEMMAGGE